MKPIIQYIQRDFFLGVYDAINVALNKLSRFDRKSNKPKESGKDKSDDRRLERNRDCGRES